MKNLSLIILLIFILFSCQESDVLSPDERISSIRIEVNGLNQLPDTLWYEAWIDYLDKSTGSEKNVQQSIGVFTVDQNGNMSENEFEVNAGYLQAAQTIYISIEKDNVPGYRVKAKEEGGVTVFDSLKGPDIYKIIAAKVAANDGNFSVGDAYLLDFDFAGAEATLILDTPTDTTQASPASGVWFVNYDTSNGMIPGLDLPDLPENWMYEALITLQGTTFSLGTFTSNFGEDDSSLYGAGHKKGYPFPGEDLLQKAPGSLTFPADLSGARVFVTINPPYPENSVYPFTNQLVPFDLTIPPGATVKTPIEMVNQSTGFPDGTVKISLTIY